MSALLHQAAQAVLHLHLATSMLLMEERLWPRLECQEVPKGTKPSQVCGNVNCLSPLNILLNI